MDDDTKLIRCEMDDTRSDLSEKLATLENRVSESVQSTGTAVSETISTVRDAIHSVSEILDIRLQVRRHPWIAFGGSVALGYLAARLLEKSTNNRVISPAPREDPLPQMHRVDERELIERISRDQLKSQRSLLFGSLMAVMLDLTARSIPVVLDYVRQQGEPAPRKPPFTPPAKTLPFSTPTSLDNGRPLTRHVF